VNGRESRHPCPDSGRTTIHSDRTEVAQWRSIAAHALRLALTASIILKALLEECLDGESLLSG
jgi:hypothetical protein